MRWESGSNMYLIHYGIKGQKHGVRRYQNEDGTLTAEGLERYGGTKDRGDRGLIKKWTLGSNQGSYAFAKWRSRRHDKNLAQVNKKYSKKIAKQEEAIKQLEGAAKKDPKHKESLEGATQATKEHLDKIQAKYDKKKEKYESKKEAQGAANADMDAYRRHRRTASLMLTNSAYKHARARGSSRARAFIEGYGGTLGLALRADADKKKYGKYIVYSDIVENDYDADAMRDDD